MIDPKNPTEVSKQAHLKSDVDSGVRAQHHTLGKGPLQAAPGSEVEKLRVALEVLGTDVEELSTQIFLLSHPVGSVFITDQAGNPGATYGGTWVAYGAGRVPVGIDATQTEFDTVNETGGFKTHTLTEAQMPIHAHAGAPLSIPTTNAVGGSAARLARGTTTNTGDVQIITGNTGNAGSGEAHNNLQPYIVAYMWKRTA